MPLLTAQRDPLSRAFARFTRQDVLDAMDLIDHYGDDWLRERTGRRRHATAQLLHEGRRYPAKATGYLAAQLCAGIARVEGTPVKVDRVLRALQRCGFATIEDRAEGPCDEE